MKQLIRIIRYRFFLFAGILPYILGASIAYSLDGAFSLFYFMVGFLGIAFVLIAVETFNEYFDAKQGGDRVFSLNSNNLISKRYFTIGIVAFGFAFIIALYLVVNRGWLIMVFAFLGFLAACFYVGPPIRLSYRGLGELAIVLSYGPLMTAGSYYLQTQRIDSCPILVSLIPSVLLLALTLINEIPDYYSDKLVGKNNIVVRMGRKRAMLFYQTTIWSSFILIGVGLILQRFSPILLLCFLTLPLAYQACAIVKKHYDYPLMFILAIRKTIVLYLVVSSLLIVDYLCS